MSDDIITKLSLDRLREVLQQSGYRVETVTDPATGAAHLRSATGGIMFDIRPGNRLAEGGDFVDAALVAAVQVQGELPLEVVNRWNATRRFARLQSGGAFLVLTQDVSAIGGVTAGHLRGHIEIWDHLVQQFVNYLREELPKLAANPPAEAALA
ncbi:MAG: YbjN domain-containing protein [Rhizobiales bacterium]|nr:YbjN domain-containing protein [Hyphomicrobiales bacterium]